MSKTRNNNQNTYQDKNHLSPQPSKRYKLYRHFKLIALALATTTVLSGITVYHIRKSNAKRNNNPEYTIGYDNINLLTNKLTQKVTSSNFVLLNIGDHNSSGTLFLEQKLNYCLTNHIKVGLLLTSNSTTLADIYFDLEYILGILENFSIEYPIYLNIDCFFNNEKLTLDAATNLINSFLEKATQNNLCIELYGNEENLAELSINYNKLAVDPQDISSYDIYKQNNFYYDQVGKSTTIIDYNMNQPQYFKEDLYYEVKDGDTLQQIAHQNKISVEDLKRYNKLYTNKLEPATILRIPSAVQLKNSSSLPNTAPIATGIDVSLWQDTINWDEVEIDYAIIQIRDFINQNNDPQFTNNITGCLTNNIPMGFYAFSRATNLEEFQQETTYIIEQLKNIPVTYPVYIDIETDFWHSLNAGKFQNTNFTETETQQFILNYLQIWENELLKAGYQPGIYCNSTLFSNLQSIVGDYLNNFSCWVAGGEYYDQELIYDRSNQLPELYAEDEQISMKQITSQGLISGITNYVDINYCYVDYTKDIYDWPRIKFSNYKPKLIYGLSTILLGGGIFLYIKKRKKTKRRVKH